MTNDSSTALIVVDMQNAFVDPAQATGVAESASVVDAVNGWVDHASDNGWPVFYTRDVAPTDEVTEVATKLYSGLDVRGTVVDKGPGKSGGFSGFVLSSVEAGDGPGGGGLSALAGLLRKKSVADIVVVGLAADVCVSATARDARRLGYNVTVPLAATAFVHAHPEGDDAAMAELHENGVVVVD